MEAITTPAPDHAFGLVCLTVGPEVRFRTITLSRYRALTPEARGDALRSIYAHNLARLQGAATFCASRGIRLYRLSSGMFPMLDLGGDDTGWAVLNTLKDELQAAGLAFQQTGIRVVQHPDQFIVLNSDRPEVRANSLHALHTHALVMDALNLSRTPWNLLLLHGGKSGRAQELTAIIPDLPKTIRLRLGLENDERAYSPAELLPICHATNTPMVFDAHHHVIHDQLPDQEHPSVRHWVLEARTTWTPHDWQLVHLSSGLTGPQDRRHAHLIDHLPSAYHDVTWIEVEAKGKEQALTALMSRHTPAPTTPDPAPPDALP